MCHVISHNVTMILFHVVMRCVMSSYHNVSSNVTLCLLCHFLWCDVMCDWVLSCPCTYMQDLLWGYSGLNYGLVIVLNYTVGTHGLRWLKTVFSTFQDLVNIWWVIITTLYLMSKSWYQQTAQSSGNKLLLTLWHNRLP